MSLKESEEILWQENWSQRPTAEMYTTLAEMGALSIPPEIINDHICIFNCSDGPSSLGLINGVLNTHPEASFTLTDISEYAITACTQYIKARHPNLGINTIHTPTEQLPQIFTSPPPHTFLSFEPIGLLEDTFRQLMTTENPAHSILIVSRGYLGIAIMSARKTSKKIPVEFNVIDVGMWTEEGPLTLTTLTRIRNTSLI